MNTTEKKEVWRLIGQAIDEAGAEGVPPAEFLTRAALLFALEIPDIARVRELIGVAHAAGAASAAEITDMRAELERTW